VTKRFDLYGSRDRSLDEVASTLSHLIGTPLELHDSSYRGGDYYRNALGEPAEIIVQRNAEDEEGILTEPDHPGHQVIVYVTAPDDALARRLAKSTDLDLLDSESG